MKMWLGLATVSLALLGCGRNEPGTMGGEPGVSETVATGAPAQAAKATSNTDRQQPALAQEHAASTFEDPVVTNSSTTTVVPGPDANKRRNE